MIVGDTKINNYNTVEGQGIVIILLLHYRRWRHLYCLNYIVRMTFDLLSIKINNKWHFVFQWNWTHHIYCLNYFRECFFTFSMCISIWITQNRIILLLFCWHFLDKQINTMKVKTFSSILTNESVFIFRSLMLSNEHEHLDCRAHCSNSPQR